jgi:hypothetical protein
MNTADRYRAGWMASKRTTTGAMVRADWSNVTLAEFDGHAILWSPNSLAHINAFWNELAVDNPFHEGPPTRLTPDGLAWFVALQDVTRNAMDEREQIRAAREFVSEMGTMLTVNVARSMRGAR